MICDSFSPWWWLQCTALRYRREGEMPPPAPIGDRGRGGVKGGKRTPVSFLSSFLPSWRSAGKKGGRRTGEERHGGERNALMNSAQPPQPCRNHLAPPPPPIAYLPPPKHGFLYGKGGERGGGCGMHVRLSWGHVRRCVKNNSFSKRTYKYVLVKLRQRQFGKIKHSCLCSENAAVIFLLKYVKTTFSLFA